MRFILLASPFPAAALLALACASAPRAPEVLARSTVGTVTVADLEKHLAARPVAAPRSADSDRHAIEEILVERAALAEALALRLDELPTVRERLLRARERILVATRLERTRRAAEATIVLDEAVVRSEVEALRRRQTSPERLRLRQIFRRVPAHAPPLERAAARAEMERIAERLRAGESFEELARRHSDSQTAAFGGLIAPVAESDLPPAVAEAVRALAPGETSSILDGSAGLQIFRLEERLPPVEPPPTAALEQPIRERLRARELAARLSAQEVALLQAAGGRISPDALSEPAVGDARIVFDDGRRRLTAGEILARWRALAFPERRTRSLRSLLEEEASRLVWLHAAEDEALDREPEVARRVDAARRGVLHDAALERRAAALASRIPVEELRRHFDSRSEHRLQPEARRVRGLLRPIADPRAAIPLADELDLVARRIRAGDLELEAAARATSADPSRLEGGDLGWAESRELALWGGSRLAQRLFALSVGEMSEPILVESYDDRRLRYEPIAWLVARVEEVRPERRPDFEEVVESIRAEAVAARDGWLGEAIRRELLESIVLEPAVAP